VNAEEGIRGSGLGRGHVRIIRANQARQPSRILMRSCSMIQSSFSGFS
jgi:hypothetical protein